MLHRIGEEALDNNSTIFSAKLANGAVESVAIADQGVYTNFMPPYVFKMINEAGVPHRVTQLYQPHT